MGARRREWDPGHGKHPHPIPGHGRRVPPFWQAGGSSSCPAYLNGHGTDVAACPYTPPPVQCNTSGV